MKRFTISTMAMGLMAASCFCAAPSQEAMKTMLQKNPAAKFFKRHSRLGRGAGTKAERHASLKARASEAAPIWRATTQKAYGWTGSDWDLEETYTFVYDMKGLPLTSTCVDAEGYITRQNNTWNENDMLAEQLTEVAEEEGADFVNSSKLIREYDTVVTDFITANTQELWMNSNWVPSNSYTQTVTRNSDGNVTKVERAILFNGEYDPTYRMELVYGDNGQATKITESELTYNYETDSYEWETVLTFTDIVWESFNGATLLSMEDFPMGDNRPSSCVITDDEYVEMPMTITYQGGGFTITGSYTNVYEGIPCTITTTSTYTPLEFTGDEGAHGEHGYVVESLMEAKIFGITMMSEKIVETAIADGNDLLLLEKAEYGTDDDLEIEFMTEGVVEYDETYGYPITWTVSEYDAFSKESVNAFRAEYSDYTNTVGVSALESETNTQAKYYNLQGVEVKNPANGIFIRVQGNRSEKVVK